MARDWLPPGDLTDRVNKRLDEIYAENDEDAMRQLDVEVIDVFQAWLEGLVRTAKKEGDFDRAVHVKHVANLVRHEAKHAREEHK